MQHFGDVFTVPQMLRQIIAGNNLTETRHQLQQCCLCVRICSAKKKEKEKGGEETV